MFNLIIALFIGISVLLIYSLLMITVETKSFEMGVMRMVGLNKTGLIVLVLTQSLMFVLPAVLFGFLLSLPALSFISLTFKEQLHFEIEPYPTQSAVIQGLAIGIIIPLLSSVLPIRVALAKNLNDSLDY